VAYVEPYSWTGFYLGGGFGVGASVSEGSASIENPYIDSSTLGGIPEQLEIFNTDGWW
jgi:hypothetical protein